jgi:predicted AAA+ superfamily ATPase
MIKRSLHTIIEKYLFTGKSILLLGPRQVGKTTLLKTISKQSDKDIIWLNGDNIDDRTLLNEINNIKANSLFPAGSFIIIDEAQRLENAGLTLKIIHDSCEDIQLIATGSSSFELTDKIKEAMTGRKWSFKLYPISLQELIEHIGLLDVIRTIDTRMIYGSYPEVVNNMGQEKKFLTELVNDYLYKDVFTLKDMRKPDVLEKLVKALAFQIGNQVSSREISNLIKVDNETVERYIFLLEEAYIIFRLNSFSRNLRNELKRSKKIYFYDTGIRNAVIGQFNPLELRNDTGALWENLMICERLKAIEYGQHYRSVYFWRTNRQQEIDFIEEYDGKLHAYEFKWNPTKKTKAPLSFRNTYPDATYNVISKDNFYEFLKI